LPVVLWDVPTSDSEDILMFKTFKGFKKEVAFEKDNN
jgi:hypothetical protein